MGQPAQETAPTVTATPRQPWLPKVILGLGIGLVPFVIGALYAFGAGARSYTRVDHEPIHPVVTAIGHGLLPYIYPPMVTGLLGIAAFILIVWSPRQRTIGYGLLAAPVAAFALMSAATATAALAGY